MVLDHGDHKIAFYGDPEMRFVGVFDQVGKVVQLLDFGAWIEPNSVPQGEERFTREVLEWAIVKDGVLFVSNGHRTYAKSSKGENAYVSAVKVDTGQLLWRSAPLVSNSHTFLFRRGHVVTGYGFTAEPDFLFVLDGQTGKTVEKISVKSGPELVLEKDGRLFVRTYDTDYVFDVR
jgi:outer membrane protein assembly factor BamB